MQILNRAKAFKCNTLQTVSPVKHPLKILCGVEVKERPSNFTLFYILEAQGEAKRAMKTFKWRKAHGA